MYVIFDFDGVIHNTPKSLVDLYNKLYSDNVGYDVSRKWNISGAKKIKNNEQVEELFEHKDMYSVDYLMDGSLELLNKLGEQVKIATIGRASNIYNKCKNIIDPYFNDIQIIGIIKKEPKNMKKEIVNMSGDIFIDDKMSNLETSNAKHKILFDTIDADWNVEWDGIKVTSMVELENVILGIVLIELDNKFGASSIFSPTSDGNITQYTNENGSVKVITLEQALKLI